jgi:molecular chaperone GrpE (heat shock protein)
VQADEQRARDNDARAILEAELRKAEARLTELRAEYNQGEPVKTPAELRNPKLYQDRLDDIKANLARAEADVEGIKRELARSTGGR